MTLRSEHMCKLKADFNKVNTPCTFKHEVKKFNTLMQCVFFSYQKKMGEKKLQISHDNV